MGLPFPKSCLARRAGDAAVSLYNNTPHSNLFLFSSPDEYKGPVVTLKEVTRYLAIRIQIILYIMFPSTSLFLLAIIANVVNCSPVSPSGRYEKLFKRQSPVDYFSVHASSPTLAWYSCYSGLQCARYVNEHYSNSY